MTFWSLRQQSFFSFMFSRHNLRGFFCFFPPPQHQRINQGFGPASPSPASYASSLAAPPGPRLRAASRSSARPAARSACSSWSCPSSGQQCELGDAKMKKKKERKKKCRPPCRHFLEKKSKAEFGAEFGADLPVVLQVVDLLPQLFQAGQGLCFSQLHPDQLLLKTGHVGVVR